MSPRFTDNGALEDFVGAPPRSTLAQTLRAANRAALNKELERQTVPQRFGVRRFSWEGQA